jgi:hypothetical protein
MGFSSGHVKLAFEGIFRGQPRFVQKGCTTAEWKSSEKMTARMGDGNRTCAKTLCGRNSKRVNGAMSETLGAKPLDTRRNEVTLKP